MPRAQTTAKRSCSVDGCPRCVYARGLCEMHYARKRRTGDVGPAECLNPRGPADVRERFWSKVDVRGPAECWEWQAALTTAGYGQFRAKEFDTAHAARVAWILTFGPITPGLHIRHVICDNPPCVNPAHLAIGTPADNMADKVAKGRQLKGDSHPARLRPDYLPRGERNGSAKLTEALVREVRKRHARGTPSKALAHEYGVSPATICNVIKRKVWAHVR